MDHRDDQNKSTDQQTDLSKAQNQQQPQSGQKGQQGQQGQQSGQSRQQPPDGQADYGSAGQSDTTTEQRSDIEGGTSTGQASDIEGSSQFVGSKGADDTSSEFIDDEDKSDFAKDRRGDGE